MIRYKRRNKKREYSKIKKKSKIRKICQNTHDSKSDLTDRSTEK